MKSRGFMSRGKVQWTTKPRDRANERLPPPYRQVLHDDLEGSAVGEMWTNTVPLKLSSYESKYQYFTVDYYVPTVPAGSIFIYAGMVRCEEVSWNDRGRVMVVMRPSFIVNGIMGVFQSIPTIMERTR